MAQTNTGSRRFAWLDKAIEALKDVGYFVVENVVDGPMLEATRNAMVRTRSIIERDIGRERLNQSGELGILRIMMKYDEHFFRFLEIPEMLAAIDAFLSPTAVLHTQNGFILPSLPPEETPRIFQNMYHQDFPRFMHGYVASLNAMFPISDYRVESGATFVVPRSHQKPFRPPQEHIRLNAVPVECAAGSMILFDSTLYHASGLNSSGAERFAVNQQFSRSFLKQQIDYCRAIDSHVIEGLPPRSQQLLGWYVRVPTSLDEYYRPAHERLYRSGQG